MSYSIEILASYLVFATNFVGVRKLQLQFAEPSCARQVNCNSIKENVIVRIRVFWVTCSTSYVRHQRIYGLRKVFSLYIHKEWEITKIAMFAHEPIGKLRRNRKGLITHLRY